MVKVQGPRLRQLTWRQKRGKSKQTARSQNSLDSGLRLFWQSLYVWRKNWRPIGGLVLVYVAISLLLAGGLTAINQLHQSFRSGSHNLSSLSHDLSSLFGLFNSTGSGANTVLQIILLIIVSLALIWLLRQILAEKPAKLKLAFYNAGAALVPFFLICLVVLIELFPSAIAAAALATVLSTPSEAWGVIFFSILFAASSWLSLYLVLGSVFSLYIVTLRGMMPWAALRSGHNLVRFRRLSVLRRILGLLIAIAVSVVAIMTPIILFVHVLAPALFFLLCLLSVVLLHTSLYKLYREMIA